MGREKQTLATNLLQKDSQIHSLKTEMSKISHDQESLLEESTIVEITDDHAASNEAIKLNQLISEQSDEIES